MEEPQIPQLRACAAYIGLTRLLLERKRVYALALHWRSEPCPEHDCVRDELDSIFRAGKWRRCGQNISYTQWNVWGVFPLLLYEIHNQNLRSMLDDDRFTEETVYMKRDAWNSFTGRAARARETIPQGMLAYALDRLENKATRGFNHFYLPVEDPEWVFEPLAKNPRLPKTGRTSVACIMSFSINVDTRRSVLHLNTIMRSSLWSHVYGDIFGTTYLANALLKQINDPQLRAECHIYFPCVSIDKPTEARKLLETIQ